MTSGPTLFDRSAISPFPPEEWPEVRAHLMRLAEEVGLPMDPQKRNVNSRFALETAELVRAKNGDGSVGAFYRDVSGAFFTEKADISKHEVIIPIAERFGASIQEARMAGATGVLALAWPHQRAIVGMMPRPSSFVDFTTPSTQVRPSMR